MVGNNSGQLHLDREKYPGGPGPVTWVAVVDVRTVFHRMFRRTFFYPERCRVDQDNIQQETGRHDGLFIQQFMDSRFTMIIFVLIHHYR